jgi:glucuronate isomerase
MAKSFINDDFMLQTEMARYLYHEHAEKMPIYDYHCHLPAKDIAENRSFENLTQIWLEGDHYKWRALRSNGIDEDFITGEKKDYEKFESWAETVPYTLRNPLYHWTALELRRYFNVDKLLSPKTAKEIFDHCGKLLQTPEFSVQNLIRKMNVKVICTTEGPLDSLEHHQAIAESGFETIVSTTLRPDAGMAVEDAGTLNLWINELEAVVDAEITDLASYLEALKKRHDYFHENGCRQSDYGLETAYAADYSASEIEKIFDKLRNGKDIEKPEQLKFRSAILYELTKMDAEAGWVMQLHIGPIRNNNSAMFRRLGPDTGFDSIGDLPQAKPLAKFLDRLNSAACLPKTILYNINPKDNATFATMIGNFQDGSVPGKIQYGPAWWFLDQADGMKEHFNILSSLGLLSRFVGMVTDSRSFLSYPRHEYFRRILCNLLANDVEAGLLPGDKALLGQMVEDICFNNAKNYFDIERS